MKNLLIWIINKLTLVRVNSPVPEKQLNQTQEATVSPSRKTLMDALWCLLIINYHVRNWSN